MVAIILFIISFCLFGAHVTAVFLPLSPVSTLIMVALCNRADHYIFMLLFVLLLLLLLFPRLISATADRMSAILPHMVWP